MISSGEYNPATRKMEYNEPNKRKPILLNPNAQETSSFMRRLPAETSLGEYRTAGILFTDKDLILFPYDSHGAVLISLIYDGKYLNSLGISSALDPFQDYEKVWRQLEQKGFIMASLSVAAKNPKEYFLGNSEFSNDVSYRELINLAEKCHPLKIAADGKLVPWPDIEPEEERSPVPMKAHQWIIIPSGERAEILRVKATDRKSPIFLTVKTKTGEEELKIKFSDYGWNQDEWEPGFN